MASQPSRPVYPTGHFFRPQRTRPISHAEGMAWFREVFAGPASHDQLSILLAIGASCPREGHPGSYDVDDAVRECREELRIDDEARPLDVDGYPGGEAHIYEDEAVWFRGTR